MPICQVCQELHRDLASHIHYKHLLDGIEYLRRYPGELIVDEDLVSERASVRDAQAATQKMMSTNAERFEGGHNMRDPKGVRAHLLAREVNGNVYDKEAAMATNKTRYGVAFHTQLPHRREANSAKLKEQMASGNIKKQEKVRCPDVQALLRLVAEKKSYSEMRKQLGCSDYLLKSWLRDQGVAITDSRLILSECGKEPDYLELIKSISAKYGGRVDRAFVRTLPRTEFPCDVSLMTKRYGSWEKFLEVAGVASVIPPRCLSARQRVEPYLQESLKQGRLLGLEEYALSYGGAQHLSALRNLFAGKLHHLSGDLQRFFPSRQWVDSFLTKVEAL